MHNKVPSLAIKDSQTQLIGMSIFTIFMENKTECHQKSKNKLGMGYTPVISAPWDAE